MRRFIVFLLSLYRKVRPYSACCRYYPSCSQYAEDAVVRYGSFFGVIMAIKRILKCNQWFPGGYDPVP